MRWYGESMSYLTCWLRRSRTCFCDALALPAAILAILVASSCVALTPLTLRVTASSAVRFAFVAATSRGSASSANFSRAFAYALASFASNLFSSACVLARFCSSAVAPGIASTALASASAALASASALLAFASAALAFTLARLANETAPSFKTSDL